MLLLDRAEHQAGGIGDRPGVQQGPGAFPVPGERGDVLGAERAQAAEHDAGHQLGVACAVLPAFSDKRPERVLVHSRIVSGCGAGRRSCPGAALRLVARRVGLQGAGGQDKAAWADLGVQGGEAPDGPRWSGFQGKFLIMALLVAVEG